MIKRFTLYNTPKEIFVTHIVGRSSAYQLTFSNVADGTTIIMDLTASQAKDLARQLLNNLNTLEVLEDIREVLKQISPEPNGETAQPTDD